MASLNRLHRARAPGRRRSSAAASIAAVPGECFVADARVRLAEPSRPKESSARYARPCCRTGASSPYRSFAAECERDGWAQWAHEIPRSVLGWKAAVQPRPRVTESIR
jgi:hypothetical protein